MLFQISCAVGSEYAKMSSEICLTIAGKLTKIPEKIMVAITKIINDLVNQIENLLRDMAKKF
jgi:hypothetical protein